MAEDFPGQPVRPPGGLGHAAIRGASWLMAQSVAGRALGFVSQLILARLLMPEDFGSLALAGTVTGMISVLVSFGVDDVLLQRQHRMRHWIAAAFWTSLGLATLAMLAVVALSPFAASMYNAPELVLMLPIMAAAMPIGAIASVPSVILRARLDFRTPALIATCELLLTQILTIILALNGAGAFSFVLPLPLVAALRSLVYWLIVRPAVTRPRFYPIRRIVARSSSIFGSKLLTMMVSQGDVFVLGLFATKAQAGAYYFGFRLAIQPVRMLAGNISNVLFPTLAQLQGDPVRQLDAAIHASRILALLVMPYCFLQAALADPGMKLLFGEKWLSAIPLIQLLSIGLAFDAVSWVAGALLSARGEFRRAFRYSCISFPVFCVAIAIGAYTADALGVAIAVGLFYMMLAPVYSYAVFHGTGASLGRIASIYVMPTLVAALTIGGAYLVVMRITDSPLIQIAAIIVCGGSGYLGVSYLTNPKLLEDMYHRIAATIRRATPA